MVQRGLDRNEIRKRRIPSIPSKDENKIKGKKCLLTYDFHTAPINGNS